MNRSFHFSRFFRALSAAVWVRTTLLALALVATATASTARPNKLPVGSLEAQTVRVDAQTMRAVEADTTTVPDVTVRTPPEDALARFRNDDAYNYERARSTGGPSLLEKLQAWLRQQFDDTAASPVSDVVLRILLVLLVTGALFFAVRQLLQMRRSSAFESSDRIAGQGDPVTRETIETTDFDDRAADALDTGDLRRAIRLRYLGLLQALIRADRIDWAPERTNVDYVDALRGADGHAAFVRATDGFEAVWYGNVEVSETTARRILDAIATARDQLTDLAPAA